MTTLTYEPARALEVVALPPRQREVLALHVGGLRYSGSRTRPAAQRQLSDWLAWLRSPVQCRMIWYELLPSQSVALEYGEPV